MARFEYIDGSYINLEFIKEFYETNGSKISIKYKDGTKEMVSTGYLSSLSGEDFITQVIPCVKPLYAAYSDNGSVVDEDIVHYLGLCSDGSVRGLVLSDGIFETANTVSNFIGLYETSQYKKGDL